MRAVVQRVSEARVTVDGRLTGEIGQGLLILLGVADGDTEADADFLVKKCLGLRIFEDDAERMNHSVTDISGGVLVVSQFTLLGDCRKGRRPSFSGAANPAEAERLYEYFTDQVRRAGVTAGTGEFGAMMDVALVNDGPVTMLLDSTRLF